MVFTEPAQCEVVGVDTLYAAIVPKIMPASHPAKSAYRWNQRVKRPLTMAGKVCRIQMPPSSCRLMEKVLGNSIANSSAPTLTVREAHCETFVSSLGPASGWKNSLKMLRVNRLAAAMDMIAAGTSAPMTMAAKATPVNQLVNRCWNRYGTASCALFAFLTLAAVVLSVRAT